MKTGLVVVVALFVATLGCGTSQGGGGPGAGGAAGTGGGLTGAGGGGARELEGGPIAELPVEPEIMARAEISALLSRDKGERVADIRKAMQEVMMDKVSVVRNEETT